MTALVETLKGIRWPRIDGAWLTVGLILAALAVLAPAQLPATIAFALKALAQTTPYILFAVLAVAYLKASGAEAIVAQAFVGRQARMIVLAAMMGGLSPVCSCEVIPFIAGLLAQGLEREEAAALGVELHAVAGDCAAAAGERGILASDLIEELRPWLNQ